jgi:hypothetical protein
VYKKLAKVLRTIGSSECIKKAQQLEDDDYKTRTLNLRNLSLKPNNITAIATILKQENYNNTNVIKSISFSYNTLMGDAGATALAKSLPTSLSEIGLVECGIGDNGGRAILNVVKRLQQLKMIFIEQNKFSDQLKMEYEAFGQANPKITVVF